MKKITKLMAIVVGMLMLPFTVDAAAQFTFDCDDKKLQPGGSTQCVIRMTEATGEGVSQVKIDVIKDTLEYIEVNGFNPNTNWKIKTSVPTLSYTLEAEDVEATKDISATAVGAYDVTLSKDAKGDCGTICVKVVYTVPGDSTEYTAIPGTRASDATAGSQDPSCEDITVDGAPVEEAPNTGAFADYAVLIGAGAIAVGAILLASKKSKFYRV